MIQIRVDLTQAGGYDLAPTLEKKPDPDPTAKKNLIQIRLEWTRIRPSGPGIGIFDMFYLTTFELPSNIRTMGYRLV